MLKFSLQYFAFKEEKNHLKRLKMMSSWKLQYNINYKKCASIATVLCIYLCQNKVMLTVLRIAFHFMIACCSLNHNLHSFL